MFAVKPSSFDEKLTDNIFLGLQFP